MANNAVLFNPFEDVTRLQREVNRLFDDSARPSGRNGNTEHAASRAWSPPVDIYEDSNEIAVRVEIAGIKQEDIDIELSGETLTIRGDRKFEDTERSNNYVRVERSYGAFQRSFTIGVAVQQEAVTASYKDGILAVHLPKSEATKPKKVQVSVG